MGRRTTITIVAVVAGIAWGGSGAPGAPAQTPVPKTDKVPEVAECFLSWARTQPPIPSVPVLVLPLGDATFLNGHLCGEIRDCAGVMMQAWLAAAGKPVPFASPEVTEAALARAGFSSTKLAAQKPGAVEQFAREASCALVATVIAEREGTITRTRIRVVDAKSGKVTGEWTGDVSEPRPTYEALFNTQGNAAMKAAAAIAGFRDSDALLASLRTRTVPAADADNVREQVSEARSLLAIPTTRRCIRSAEIAQAIVDKYPGEAEVWAALAAAQWSLSDILEFGVSRQWHEAVLRAMAAGEVAAAISPKSPAGRFGKLISLIATGRRAEALRTAAAFAEQGAPDLPTSLTLAFAQERFRDFPAFPASGSPIEHEVWELLAPRLELKAGAVRQTAQLEQWLRKEPYAPGLWLHYGDAKSWAGQLGEWRQANVTEVVISAVNVLDEVTRQARKAGKADLATRAERALADAGLAVPSMEPPPAGGEVHEAVVAAIAGKDPHAAAAVFSEIDWSDPKCRVLALIRDAERLRRETMDAVTSSPAVRTARAAYGVDARVALETAGRTMADAAGECIRDLALRLYVPEGDAAGKALVKAVPGDAAVTLAALQAQSVHAPGDMKLDSLAAFRCDPFFLTIQTNGLLQAGGTVDEASDTALRLKYFAPFHIRTLTRILTRMAGLGNAKEAASVARLLLARNPLHHSARVEALTWGARAQLRLVTEDEVRKLDATLPPDCPQRNLLMARTWAAARRFDRATECYGRAFAEKETRLSSDFENASNIALLSAQPEKAREFLDAFLAFDDTSLAASSVLEHLAFVEQRALNLDKAQAAYERAGGRMNYQESVILRGAFIAWAKGDHATAIREFHKSVARYNDSNSRYWLCRALAADGQTTTAWALLQEPGGGGDSESQALSLRAELMRMRGETAAVTGMLKRWMAEHDEDPRGARQLAIHFQFTGDPAMAAEWADKALEWTHGDELADALETAAKMRINAGETSGALELITRLNVCFPDKIASDCLRARLALSERKPDEALKHLRSPLATGEPEARFLVAAALSAKGDKAGALEQARAAAKMFMWPEAEWLVEWGKAAEAAGKPDEAAEARKLCVRLYGRDLIPGQAAGAKTPR